MTRITKKFEGLRNRGDGALIGFVTAGDPSPDGTIDIVGSLISGGIDILELGLPFSDPIADGPTIQKANKRSLEEGMNTDVYFNLVKRIDKRYPIPKICLTYYNIVLQYGLERFARKCKTCGIDGLIVPDLPVEESRLLSKSCKKNNIDLIFLVAPTTTPDRLRLIVKNANGFLYVVSLLGVTGARKGLSGSVMPLIKRVKNISGTIPIAVGFGISRPEHVRAVIAAGADGAIVGSAFVNLIEKNAGSKKKLLSKLEGFTRRLKLATE